MALREIGSGNKWKILMKINPIYLMLLLVATSCSSSHYSDEAEKREYMEQVDKVDYKILALENFEQEFISNGKLEAAERVVLKFEVGGQLATLKVKNGDYVYKGSVLAVLNQEEYKRSIEDAAIALKKARVDMLDFLLGQGYQIKDSLKVPAELKEIASIRSGYSVAKNQMKKAKLELANTIIRAPFDGKAANLRVSLHDQVNTGEEICTIINDRQMNVLFHLVETEIHHIILKDKVSVMPIATSDTINGYVKEINPVVDENGMVEVKAIVKNDKRLLDGMHVKISVKKAIPDQLVVPKEAVVLRQNQEVLFKYKEGTAYWTYVQTGLENSNHYTVIADPDKGAILNERDTVIISNNLNLAHESKVALK
jgi:membrane fusion protein (multidrug efflux system)